MSSRLLLCLNLTAFSRRLICSSDQLNLQNETSYLQQLHNFPFTDKKDLHLDTSVQFNIKLHFSNVQD